MDETPKSLAESLAVFHESFRPLRELSGRMKQITEPLRQASEPYQRLAKSLQPFTQIKQHKQNGVVLPQSCLLPQQSNPPTTTPKPPPEKRPSTHDKDADRREIYEQVVREFGRYCQRGLLEREAAKRAGCSERTMREALKSKK